MDARINQIIKIKALSILLENRLKRVRNNGFLGFLTAKRDAEREESFNNGLRIGIEMGLRESTINGQMVNCQNFLKENGGKEFEFYEKFLNLAREYGCSIVYHYQHGMIVVKDVPEFEYENFKQ